MSAVVTTRELNQAGWSTHEIRAFMRAGRLTRLRRGVYRWVEPATAGDVVQVPADVHERDHQERMDAFAAAISPRSVFSHASAAVAHGIPVRRALLGQVQVTRPDRRSGRSRGGLVVRSASLPAEQVCEQDGRRVTTAARTACDLARHEPIEWGVGALDDVLHRGLASLDDLRAIADGQSQWVGHRALARALALADARSESIGESISRVRLHEAGLMPDELQRCIRVEGVDYRVDFFWECGVIGEFDGRSKYGDSGDAVWREKQREDALRRAGFVVVRWAWDEITRAPQVVVARIRRALEQAQQSAA